MGSLHEGEYSPSYQHHTILQDVVEPNSVTDCLVRSYTRSFNGFAAMLTNKESEKLASMEEVVSVFPSRNLQLQTTRSWDFMGFPESVKRNPTVESEVIVGHIDSGIWPESKSFMDEGFGPAPKKWKGVCEGGMNFTCNNKIIGARSYSGNSALDIIGHGTHTASTVVGNNVKGSSFYGFGQGSARGGVPSARIAVYRVCATICSEAAILAAFDDAISDGVDIITISMGTKGIVDLIHDSMAIGAFHAMERGILTVQGAGNKGSRRSTVTSTAPWLLSVAASSTDRRIIDKVNLGNGITLAGTSLNTFTLNDTKFPLIFGKHATRQCNESSAWECADMCLDSHLVKGKIVVCNDSSSGPVDAGGVGTIMLNKPDDLTSSVASFPSLFLNVDNSLKLMSYINSTKIPQANILRSEVVKDLNAPIVASFSSRGPNPVIPDILKPDISAPGIDILAAYPPNVSPSLDIIDKRSVKYNILSGTSMACPHAAGAAAYLKTFHPHWPPSAIHSALMTTAWPMNGSTISDKEFAYGSGHINPVKAVDPGLVYEAFKDDYIKMLCGMGYNETTIRLISGDKSTCPKNGQTKASPKDLNYPSMTVKVNASKAFKVDFVRTVTNVGSANSTYKAKVFASSSKISIMVEPNVLLFKSLNDKKSFVVTVTGTGVQSMVSSHLVWSDGAHSVRSPIIIYTELDT